MVKSTVFCGTKFKAGDVVVVTRHSNQERIREIKMDQIPLRDKARPEITQQWKPLDLKFDRKSIRKITQESRIR